ncbi:MAG: ABC transporter permease subunit [Clostridia bacterium]|nr:ABC transporter permease subunit [Clostridia bacterium]
MTAIYKRELRAYFSTGLGYVFCAVFLGLTGFAFSMFTLQPAIGGSDMSLPVYYSIVIIALVVLLPILTMKSFAEERKSKTEQLLLTAPVSLTSMVCGKFFAALTVFAGCLAATCSYYTVIALYCEKPNFGVLYGYIIGIFCLGSAFIAIGIFVSALTQNQLSAAVGTMGVLIVMIGVGFLNSYIDSIFVRTVLSWISLYDRFERFCYGQFDFVALLYYISVCFAFIFLTVRVYEKRRWA